MIHVIKTQDLTVSYDNQVVALEGVNLELAGPTITGIIGPNGAGKSTFVKAILNMVDHDGQVFLDGVPAKKMLKKVAYVGQKSDIDFNFPIKVKECVSLGTYSNLGIFRKVSKKEWNKVEKALAQVGLSDFANRQISALSGGQFQRVLMARCLVQEADYIFLDEPFTGIDSVSEEIIMKILKDLKNQGKTVLIVHHDLHKVRRYFDQLIIINKQLIAVGPTEQVFNDQNMKAAYGDSVYFGKGGDQVWPWFMSLLRMCRPCIICRMR